jgi:hypothetical protein
MAKKNKNIFSPVFHGKIYIAGIWMRIPKKKIPDGSGASPMYLS